MLQNAFKAVAQEQGFESMHSDALKLIIIDVLNRKVKERNPEFVASTTDISNVKAVRGYFERSSQLKQLIRDIKKADCEIRETRQNIERVGNSIDALNTYRCTQRWRG